MLLVLPSSFVSISSIIQKLNMMWSELEQNVLIYNDQILYQTGILHIHEKSSHLTTPKLTNFDFNHGQILITFFIHKETICSAITLPSPSFKPQPPS